MLLQALTEAGITVSIIVCVTVLLLFEYYRFRGFVEDGFNDTTMMSNSIRGVKYWQVQTARLAFVVVFEV